MESRSAYGFYGAAGGYTGENKTEQHSVRMPYWEYKKKWADHKTVPGSYDCKDKTIEVCFSTEEMKAKTNYGNRYELWSYYFRFGGVEKGISPVCEFKAKNEKNAEKNAKTYARRNGYDFIGEASLDEYIKAIGW